MKKIVFCLMFLLVMPNIASSTEFVLRGGIKWGLSENEVRQIEKGALLSTEKGLVYDVGMLFDMETIVMYNFTADDKLGLMQYVMSMPSERDDIYIYYSKIKQELSSKYGEPITDSETWVDKDAKNKYHNNKGRALRNNQLNLEAVWKTPDTRIILIKNEIGADTIFLLYESEKYAMLVYDNIFNDRKNDLF